MYRSPAVLEDRNQLEAGYELVQKVLDAYCFGIHGSYMDSFTLNRFYFTRTGPVFDVSRSELEVLLRNGEDARDYQVGALTITVRFNPEKNPQGYIMLRTENNYGTKQNKTIYFSAEEYDADTLFAKIQEAWAELKVVFDQKISVPLSEVLENVPNRALTEHKAVTALGITQDADTEQLVLVSKEHLDKLLDIARAYQKGLSGLFTPYER